MPGHAARRLTAAAGPPLGSGPIVLGEEQVADLPPGAVVALYTDGLVERRDSHLDSGIDALAAELTRTTGEIAEAPRALVGALLDVEPDDDVAVLVARVPDAAPQSTATMRDIPAEPRAVGQARRFAAETFERWGVSAEAAGDAVLLVSELVTNAVLHGREPIVLRVRQASDAVVIEVFDGATFLPRRLRPTPDDEHGRGLQLVASLADRWGTRPLRDGKAVWCVVSLSRAAPSRPRSGS